MLNMVLQESWRGKRLGPYVLYLPSYRCSICQLYQYTPFLHCVVSKLESPPFIRLGDQLDVVTVKQPVSKSGGNAKADILSLWGRGWGKVGNSL